MSNAAGGGGGGGGGFGGIALVPFFLQEIIMQIASHKLISVCWLFLIIFFITE